MIIKQTENRDVDIIELYELLKIPYLNTNTKDKINQEIKNIKSGFMGEKEAAYNIDFHYKDSKNWMVIHDLRLEYNNQVAQIDHLLLNRFMEIYVCESKRFSEGIIINEHGEFSAFHQGKPYGVPSPIEQNNRHIKFLERFFNNNEIELPTRLGLKIKPRFHSLVLIANSAHIIRPQKNIEDLETIIKNEQVFKKINKDMDNENIFSATTSIAKIISSETLKSFAESLAAQHKQQNINWKARFGITDSLKNINSISENKINKLPIETEYNIKHNNSLSKNTYLSCAACAKPVTPNVAQFCRNHKTKFKGKIYCYNCQKDI